MLLTLLAAVAFAGCTSSRQRIAELLKEHLHNATWSCMQPVSKSATEAQYLLSDQLHQLHVSQTALKTLHSTLI